MELKRYDIYGEHDYNKDNTWYESEESTDGKWVKYEDVEKLEKENKEMLDCIHNFMGIFDTPIGRRRNNTSLDEEIRKIGREIMERNGRKIWRIE